MLTVEFKKRAYVIHNHKYEYNILLPTVVAKDKVSCVCPRHGEFLTRVHDHIYNTSGCKQCADELRSNRNIFISDAARHHGTRYDYSNTKYINNYTPVVITCTAHGDFMQIPSVHLSAVIGCVKCKAQEKSLSHDEFLQKASCIHGKLYDYSYTKYIKCKEKVNIICKTHGMFTQTPDNHINRGSGCPKCAVAKKTGMYNAHHICTKTTKNNTSGILYLAMFESNTEQFLKVGITVRKGVKYRYGKHHKGYTINALYEKHMNILEANILEQHIIHTFAPERYIPSIKFGGYTECFNPTIKQQVLHYITN